MISSYSRRELLSKHFLMSTLPQRTLDDLVKFTTIARVKPHRVIFSKSDPGDCLYGILAGRVRIFSTSPEGDEIVLDILESGKLFREIAFLVGSTRTASAAAMEQTDLMRIHRDHFLPYVRSNPDLLLNIVTRKLSLYRCPSTKLEAWPVSAAKLPTSSSRYGARLVSSTPPAALRSYATARRCVSWLAAPEHKGKAL
jgi:CRP-like cAMP-binding protein